MARLTQGAFARRLAKAQEALAVSNIELAKLTGIDQTTISRYRDEAYASGPPSALRRRVMEQGLSLPLGYVEGLIRLGLGLPRGYLDGTADADFNRIRLRRESASSDPQASTAPLRPHGEVTRDSGPDVAATYHQAIGVLSRAADREGSVKLADALIWLETVYAAATGQPVTAPRAGDAELASDLDAIRTAERLEQATTPPAATGTKRR